MDQSHITDAQRIDAAESFTVTYDNGEKTGRIDASTFSTACEVARLARAVYPTRSIRVLADGEHAVCWT